MIPLVLVHGFMGGSAQWDYQVKCLSGDCEVIAVELPGYGNLSAQEALCTIEAMADSVLANLSELGVVRFNLLGHSMGGMVVQEMTFRAPERVEKLVLYGTGSIGALPGRFEPIEISKQRAVDEGCCVTARRISATWFSHGERSKGYEICAEIAQKSSLQAILAGLDAMSGWSGESNLVAITCPTLVLWGDGDKTYTWAQTESLWRNIGNTNLAVISGCAHAVHLEQPEQFNLALISFLRA